MRLFDPQADSWNDHFEANHGRIQGKTAIRRATVQVLNMNAAEAVLLRTKLFQEDAL